MISLPFLRSLFWIWYLEFYKPYSTSQLFDGSLPETSAAALPMTTVEERIPVVHSLTIWKMCEALDLKAQFVPLPEPTALPRTPRRDTDQTTTVPVVGSFSVWKICQALDLPATYDPQMIRTAVFRKSNKPVPVVHSTAIFKLCKALDLKAKLAPQ
ncbi:hypothetical protein TNCT_408061 [Trichonephila clavata]|uniref:Uncharacterized protein n=1 Tax=Trichonephila clavata TaxID=2740835 RepID=A0A8X6GXX2_TRICU|nr:hypothetical protein TNCT_408061 [Trichonephila clavata]